MFILKKNSPSDGFIHTTSRYDRSVCGTTVFLVFDERSKTVDVLQGLLSKFLHLSIMIYAARALLFLCAVASVVADYPPLLPFPYYALLGNSSVTVDGSFQFVVSGSSNSIIDSAITRYGNLLATPSSSTGSLTSCSLSVTDIDTTASIIGSDESHKLTISETGECSISAQTTWGLLHGMETFTQLLIRSDSGDIQMNYAPVSLQDQPRFGHRGLMIDTARHYLPVETIRHVIDSLPMSK